MKLDKKIGVVLIIILQLGLSTTLYCTGTSSVTTRTAETRPINPLNCTEPLDDHELNIKILEPASLDTSEKYPAILMFHGLGRTLEDHDYFARKLAQRGIVCFCMDFHGHGDSGGVFPTENGDLYNATYADALGLLDFVNNENYIDTNKILAYGISLGGGAALYLAISGLVPKFLTWYPGIAYYLNQSRLYTYQGLDNNENFGGLILAGTEDECSRCAPEYVNFFDSNNPSVEVKWLEGATHTDGDFFLECVDHSLLFIDNLWNLKEPSKFTQYYEMGYIGIGVLGIFIVGDLMLFLWRKRKKKD